MVWPQWEGGLHFYMGSYREKSLKIFLEKHSAYLAKSGAKKKGIFIWYVKGTYVAHKESYSNL